MNRSLPFAAALLAGLSSCTSVEMAREREVRRMDPAPFVVAVAAPSEATSLRSSQGAYAFEADAAGFQRLLIESLVDLNAASSVIPAQDGSKGVDLVIRPRINQPATFRHEGVSGTFWASGLLWIGTWIGGLGVNDSSYTTDMKVAFDLQLTNGDLVEVNATSGPVTTSFLERNPFFSWQTVQTFVLPPFWTTDHTRSTGEMLTQRSTADVAVDLAGALKGLRERLSEKRSASMLLKAPANGAEVPGDRMTLRATLEGFSAPIDEVGISVNRGQEQLLQGLADANEETDRASWRYELEQDVALDPGENLVRVRFVSAKSVYRTLRIHSGVRAQ